MLFLRKTDETIWKPPFLRDPPFQLTPYFWAIFSWPPSLSKFQKQEPPSRNFSGGEENDHTYKRRSYDVQDLRKTLYVN